MKENEETRTVLGGVMSILIKSLLILLVYIKVHDLKSRNQNSYGLYQEVIDENSTTNVKLHSNQTLIYFELVGFEEQARTI